MQRSHARVGFIEQPDGKGAVMATPFKFDPATIRVSEEEILADLTYPARRPRRRTAQDPFRPHGRRHRRRR